MSLGGYALSEKAEFWLVGLEGEAPSKGFVLFDGGVPIARLAGDDVRWRAVVGVRMTEGEMRSLPVWPSFLWHRNESQTWTPVPVTLRELERLKNRLSPNPMECFNDEEPPTRAALLKELAAYN